MHPKGEDLLLKHLLHLVLSVALLLGGPLLPASAAACCVAKAAPGSTATHSMAMPGGEMGAHCHGMLAPDREDGMRGRMQDAPCVHAACAVRDAHGTQTLEPAEVFALPMPVALAASAEQPMTWAEPHAAPPRLHAEPFVGAPLPLRI